MERDAEYVNIEFNNSASKLFFSLYSKFEESVRRLDRRKDENVFQQLLGKYVYTLKHQLEDMAGTLIAKYQSLKNITQLTKEMTEKIKDYTREFIQKSKSI